MTAVLAPPETGRIGEAIDALSQYRSPDDPGWTRRVFSEPYLASRDLVTSLMRDAGLRVDRDGAGNLIGVLDGQAPGAPALVVGSHTDTVHGGGRFDGVVGVVGAIEAVHMLRASGLTLARELRVVDFVGEEPNEFGVSCIGSRAIEGTLASCLDSVRADGVPLAEAYSSLMTTAHDAVDARWAPGSIGAFVELHIEQGPVLDRLEADVGVVTTIVGVARMRAVFSGRRDHAGTTSMLDRRDAAAGAAHAMYEWEQLARVDETSVITVGSIDLAPGAVNIVPERAVIVAEVRSPTTARLRELMRSIESIALDAAEQRRCAAEVHWTSEEPAIDTHASVQAAIERAVVAEDREPVAVTSGAEHDTVHLAGLAPAGMIFVPSRGGRSHCPEEHTDVEAIATGVRVLARTLIELDGSR